MSRLLMNGTPQICDLLKREPSEDAALGTILAMFLKRIAQVDAQRCFNAFEGSGIVRKAHIVGDKITIHSPNDSDEVHRYNASEHRCYYIDRNAEPYWVLTTDGKTALVVPTNRNFLVENIEEFRSFCQSDFCIKTFGSVTFVR